MLAIFFFCLIYSPLPSGGILLVKLSSYEKLEMFWLLPGAFVTRSLMLAGFCVCVLS
ncbi:hypothetical protein T492DRAFT_934776 [Pavlovales sp. CCMP2436]|nr:hypothetical protein T492DRAFT_934776 [Pavlovales sp. CCMP2436]